MLTASLGQTIDYSRRFYPNMPDIPIIVPFLVALAVCMLLGLFNGTVIAKFAIPPFIVTLGTQVIAWGVNLLYFDLPPNSSQPIGGVKKSITYMGSGLLGGKVPVIILIALAVTLAVWFILKKLRFGRNVYAVGGNAEAANVSGIKVTATLIGVYGIAGLLYSSARGRAARPPPTASTMSSTRLPPASWAASPTPAASAPCRAWSSAC